MVGTEEGTSVYTSAISACTCLGSGQMEMRNRSPRAGGVSLVSSHTRTLASLGGKRWRKMICVTPREQPRAAYAEGPVGLPLLRSTVDPVGIHVRRSASG